MLKKIALLLIVLLLFAGCETGAKKEKKKEEETIITSTPEITATAEITATPEVTAEPQTASIRNKLQYEKEVIIPEVYKDMENDFRPHKVLMPEIVDDGEAVKIINEKMYNTAKEYIELLQKNEEKDWLIQVSYKSTEKDGIFGIIIINRVGVMYSEWWDTYDVFYYDSVENRELSAEEYYSKIGVTTDQLWQKIKTATEFVNNEDFYWNATLDKAISDGNTVYAIINTPDAFSENALISVE